MSGVTTWGQLDNSWIGKRVVVRWEDGSEPLFDGGPSGIPHEVSGLVTRLCDRLCIEAKTLGHFAYPRHIWAPEDAHVQELADAEG